VHDEKLARPEPDVAQHQEEAIANDAHVPVPCRLREAFGQSFVDVECVWQTESGRNQENGEATYPKKKDVCMNPLMSDRA
jgi:hypothetical protein